ncbi:MAG: hypothetical protein QM690_16270, partial [Sphingobium sp.]
KSYPDIPLKELTPGTAPLAEQFYKILIEDRAFRSMSESEKRFFSDFLFDALVRAPRSRILHRQELDNSRAAIRAHLERTLHILSTSAPFLAQPAPKSDASIYQEQQ